MDLGQQESILIICITQVFFLVQQKHYKEILL